MNIAIQKADSREFLGENRDDWVRDPHAAKSFHDARAAIAFCRRQGLENVRLVVFFGDRKVSLLLYVPGSATPQPTGATKAVAA